MNNQDLSENNDCLHKHKSIVVIDGFAQWEVIALECSDCKNKLLETIS
ncbi:hypothetical protein [Tenacibaculum aiptasiae]|nr:hypothetical protein [Tenacibaculum aiptasiae]